MKRVKCWHWFFLVIPMAVALTGCNNNNGEDQPAGEREGEQAATTQPRAADETADRSAEEPIYTTFYPLYYFTTRIVGDLIDVELPLPEDEDAIYWQPSRDVLQQYQSASLIIINGAEFEKWVETASLPQSRLVNTAHDFREQWLQYEEVTHSHGPGGEHTHEGIDGHTWLDPILAIRQSEAIREAAIERWPGHEAQFRANFRALRDDLRRLHTRLNVITETMGELKLIGSHPAYNYLDDRYAWNLTNIDIDPEHPLTSEARHELEHELTPDQPAILLWEQQPDQAVEERISREFNVVHVVFTPAENPSPDELSGDSDYLSIMNDNLDRLVAAIEQVQQSVASDDQEQPRTPPRP